MALIIFSLGVLIQLCPLSLIVSSMIRSHWKCKLITALHFNLVEAIFYLFIYLFYLLDDIKPGLYWLKNTLWGFCEELREVDGVFRPPGTDSSKGSFLRFEVQFLSKFLVKMNLWWRKRKKLLLIIIIIWFELLETATTSLNSYFIEIATPCRYNHQLSSLMDDTSIKEWNACAALSWF